MRAAWHGHTHTIVQNSVAPPVFPHMLTWLVKLLA